MRLRLRRLHWPRLRRPHWWRIKQFLVWLLMILGCPILFPLYTWLLGKSFYEDRYIGEKGFQKRRKAETPKPLPARRRALSLPLPFQEKPLLKRRQKTKNQERSILFNKLSAELRVMIWQYVVGGEVLHIFPVPAKKKLYHVVCRALEPTNPMTSNAYGSHQNCSVRMGAYGQPAYRSDRATVPWSYTEMPKEPKQRRLALLRTCRRVYTEAVPILYSHNTFDFRHLDTVHYFSTVVLPSRLHMVRSLNLQWWFRHNFDITRDAPSNRTHWDETINIIASMRMLRDLTFILKKNKLMLDTIYIFESLRRIDAKGDYCVCVHWGQSEVEKKYERQKLPYEIVRREASYLRW